MVDCCSRHATATAEAQPIRERVEEPPLRGLPGIAPETKQISRKFRPEWRERAVLSEQVKHEGTKATKTHEGSGAQTAFLYMRRRGDTRARRGSILPSPSCVSVLFVTSCFNSLGQIAPDSWFRTVLLAICLDLANHAMRGRRVSA